MSRFTTAFGLVRGVGSSGWGGGDAMRADAAADWSRHESQQYNSLMWSLLCPRALSPIAPTVGMPKLWGEICDSGSLGGRSLPAVFYDFCGDAEVAEGLLIN